MMIHNDGINSLCVQPVNFSMTVCAAIQDYQKFRTMNFHAPFQCRHRQAVSTSAGSRPVAQTSIGEAE